MLKVLKVTFPQKCIGCELCVSETQRQLKRVGLEGALIRIFKEKSSTGENRGLIFSLQLDPTVNTLNLQKIAEICPTGVFTLEEASENNGLIS